MGIQGLMKLITEECPRCVKEVADMESLTGRKVAIDASMALYQFLVAVRTNGPGGGMAAQQLTNEAGEVTSHIQGMFNRTIKMMTSGVRPLYVFDGKPPTMKGGELAKRIAKRAKAEIDHAEALEGGDIDEVDKFSRRLVKVTRQHNEDCKELLRLMGVPYINAPCEAEAQCAELAKKGKVYATATEDMDALTFRTPKLLRRFTFSQGKDKQNILEIDFAIMLEGLGLTYDEFVDLCIMCGCDYCSTIKGIGPKTALKLIRQYKTIENVIAQLKREKKYDVPPDWMPMKVRKEVAKSGAAAEADDEMEDADEEAVDADGAMDATVAGVEENKDEEKQDKEGVAAAGAGADEAARGDAGAESLGAADDAAAAVASSSQSSAVEGSELAKSDGGGDDDAKGADALGGAAADTVSEGEGGDDGDEGKGPEEKGEEEGQGEAEGEDGEYEIVPPLYQQARGLFHNHEVMDGDELDLQWTAPDEPGLMAFLVDKMGFSAERVKNGIKKLQDAQKMKSQKRMDSFFTAMPSASSSSSAAGAKRKAEEAAKGKGGPAKKGAAAAPAKKGGPGPRRR